MSVEISDEVELVRLASAGDEPAFRTLIERYQSCVFRHATFLTATREDAEDVLQETFLALLKHGRDWRAEASLKTWLFTVARNAAHRSRTVDVHFPAVEQPLEELAQAAGWGAAATGDDPHTLVELAEDREALARALGSLAAEDREIILLRDLENIRGEAVAAALGLTLPAMKSRLHRARLRLAQALRQQGGGRR